MPTPPEIQPLVDQLNQELNQIEQETREGLNLGARITIPIS